MQAESIIFFDRICPKSVSGGYTLTNTLLTLPQKEIQYGLAEIVRTAMMMDAELFACLERCRDYSASEFLRDVITRAATIKAETFLCVEAGGVIWVGAAGATDTPPEFAGYVPLRSVATQADAAALAQASGLEQAAQGLLGSTAAGGVCLILSTSQTKTTIHALAAKEADRVALSRWLDGVVRRAEARGLA